MSFVRNRHAEDFVTRKLAAEFAGTAFLLATVVGSGIMGERLAAGNVAIALIAATALFRWLVPSLPRAADDVVLPHRGGA